MKPHETSRPLKNATPRDRTDSEASRLYQSHQAKQEETKTASTLRLIAQAREGSVIFVGAVSNSVRERHTT